MLTILLVFLIPSYRFRLGRRHPFSLAHLHFRPCLTSCAIALTSFSEHGLQQQQQQIEASWKHLSTGEQAALYQHLEQVQKKDWKELSVVEKKAGASDPVLRSAAAAFRFHSANLTCFAKPTMSLLAPTALASPSFPPVPDSRSSPALSAPSLLLSASSWASVNSALFLLL